MSTGEIPTKKKGSALHELFRSQKRNVKTQLGLKTKMSIDENMRKVGGTKLVFSVPKEAAGPSTPEDADRAELFGKHAVSASYTPKHKLTKEEAKVPSSEIQAIADETRRKLMEREKKLEAMQDKAEDMASEANTFAQKTKMLKDKQSKGFFGMF